MITADEALRELSRRHAAYLLACGLRFSRARFRSEAVPDWVYYPVEHRVYWRGHLRNEKGAVHTAVEAPNGPSGARYARFRRVPATDLPEK